MSINRTYLRLTRKLWASIEALCNRLRCGVVLRVSGSDVAYSLAETRPAAPNHKVYIRRNTLPITTQGQAMAAGYTQRCEIDGSGWCLSVLVRPNTDTETTFRAFDIEENELLRINGWLIESIDYA